MGNLGPLARPESLPMPPRGTVIATYPTYLEAQRAVDFLSDSDFPVHTVTIVGHRLQMVERVTGRLTYSRVALAGAASGAWFGLLIGLMLSWSGGQERALLAAPLFGAAFGMLYGVISYLLTGGRRDFTSTSQIVAGEYVVLCPDEDAERAARILTRLPGGSWPHPHSWWRHPPAPEPGPRPEARPWSESAPQTQPAPTSGSGAAAAEEPGAVTATGPGEVAGPEPDASLTYGEVMARRRRREREQRERDGGTPG